MIMYVPPALAAIISAMLSNNNIMFADDKYAARQTPLLNIPIVLQIKIGQIQCYSS